MLTGTVTCSYASISATRWIAIYGVILFCGLVASLTSNAADVETLPAYSSPAKVLIIHSSHKGFPWTDSIDRGIRKVLDSAFLEIEMQTEYLDTKRYNTPLYFEEVYTLWKTILSDRKFDVVITSDNDAFDFAIKHRTALFHDAPLVFSGLNNFDPIMLSGHQAITGVVENEDFVATIDLALKLHPKTREIVLIVPGRAEFRMKMVEDLPSIYEPDFKISYVDEVLISDVEKRIKGLSPNSILIPVASARTQSGDGIAYPEFVSRISRISNAPVYSVWDLALGHGIVGGRLTNGLAQGETAAFLALEIIRGRNPGELPIVTNSPNRYMFDHTQLERFGIPEENLPADSIVINRTPSFYDQHTVLIWSVAAVIIGLSGLVAVLIVAIILSRNLRRKAEKADQIVKEAHLRLVHLVEHLPAGAIHLDGDNLLMNRAAEAITGYSRSEIVTLDAWLQALFRDRWREIRDLHVIDRMAGYPRSREFPIFHNDGSERLIEFTGHASGDQAIWLLNDVTARRHAQAELKLSEARLQSIIETVPDAIVTINDRGLIESFSIAAEKMFNYSASEVIGKNVAILMPAPYRDEHDGYLAHYLSTGEKRVIGIIRELEAETKDGTIFPVEFSVGEVALEDQARFFVGVIRDITERRKAQNRIDDLREDLFHVSRIAEISELTADLAHEINQPLGAVKNYVEASRELLSGSTEAIAGQATNLMGKAIRQADRAAEIVRRLRRFIEKGEITRSSEQVTGIVEEAWELAKLGTERRKIMVLFNLDAVLPDVFVDRLQIQQVVLNLLRNAQEAVSNSSQRQITVNAKRLNTGFVEIVVTDTGPGIQADIADRLFQPFVTTKANGIGIGLSISRSIIEAHGGRLWAEAGSAGGTMFHFTLPAAG